MIYQEGGGAKYEDKIPRNFRINHLFIHHSQEEIIRIFFYADRIKLISPFQPLRPTDINPWENLPSTSIVL